jgi:hypothetical protein
MKIARTMNMIQTRNDLAENGRDKAARQWTALPSLDEMV